MIVFVSGGARSGKSQVAEQCVLEAAGKTACYYIATAKVYDAEMAERVARHQSGRDACWVTLEAPLAIDYAIAQVPDGHAVLLDCLTLWASQVMFSAGLNPPEGLRLLERALEDARSRGLTLVVVSNDLNEELIPSQPDTWRYVAFIQQLHCRVAALADSVLEVIAGCALEWKPAKEGDQ